MQREPRSRAARPKAQRRRSASRFAVPAAGAPVGTYIKHVVIIIQKIARSTTRSTVIPAKTLRRSATCARAARNAKVVKVPLTPAPFGKQDECHAFSCGIIDFDRGKMDGFGLPMINPGEAGNECYTYLPRTQVRRIGRWRTIRPGRPNVTTSSMRVRRHLDLVRELERASDESVVEVPTQVRGAVGYARRENMAAHQGAPFLHRPFPCFTQFATLADTSMMLKFREVLCAGGGQIGLPWSIFQSIASVYKGRDWKRNVITATKVLRRRERNAPASLGSSPTARTRITPATAATMDRPGGFVVKRSARTGLELNRDRRVWTTGRLSITFRRRNSTFAVSACAFRASSSRRMRAEATSRTPSTSSAAYCTLRSRPLTCRRSAPTKSDPRQTIAATPTFAARALSIRSTSRRSRGPSRRFQRPIRCLHS